MPRTLPATTPRVGSETRNVYIDWARAASVCVVVLFHSRLFTLTRVDGSLQLTMWDPNRLLWIVSWPLMAIPVFFVAGGYGHSVNMVKARRCGTGYGYFLAARGRRLLGPTTVFVGITAVVATVLAAWTSPQQMAALSASGMSLLWFITAYLGITLVAPFMVGLQDRHPVAVLSMLVVLAICIDALSRATGSQQLALLNLGPVWLFAHQLGIAYHHGWFRTWRRSTLLAVGALSACLILILIFFFHYPPVSVGVGSIPIANVLPPTFAMVPLALAQTCGLAWFEKADPPWATSARALGPVTAINALLMTIYLWHVPCVIAANAIVWMSGVADVLSSDAAHLIICVLSVGLVALVTPLIGRVDSLMVSPLGPVQSTGWAIAAVVVALAAVAIVWQCGVVVSPQEPWSSLGVVGVGAAWWMMRRAANAPRQ